MVKRRIRSFATIEGAVLPENVSVESYKCADSFGTAIVHSTKPATDSTSANGGALIELI